MSSITGEALPETVAVQQVMGTVVSYRLRGAGDHRRGIAAASAWLDEVDARFSTYRPDSEVSSLDRGMQLGEVISLDLSEVIRACAAVEQSSHGAFSAFRAGRFDPSGYVKGWSVERAGAILRSHGCQDWAVNAGGDVKVSSSSLTSTWRIGVQHPFDRRRVATVLHAGDLAVATSGLYERGNHLVDPRSGTTAAAVASTTVCGQDLGLADAYATAAFVLGTDGPAWIAEIPGYECWCVLNDGRVLSTSGFPRVVLGVPVVAVPHPAVVVHVA